MSDAEPWPADFSRGNFHIPVSVTTSTYNTPQVQIENK